MFAVCLLKGEEEVNDMIECLFGIDEKDGGMEEGCLLEGDDEALISPMLLSTNDVPIVWGR